MDRVTDIFDQDIQNGETTDDLDADLVNASLVLQKVAADEGIDLASLSEEDVADLIVELLPHEKVAKLTQPEPQTKEASQDMSQNQITIADVAQELSKIAQDEGIDLTQVTKEEYEQAFDALAEKMASPSYAEEKVASEKVAEAREYGAQMAEGFLDRLKQAGETPDAEKQAAAMEHLRRFAGKAKEHAGRAASAIADSKAGKAVDRAAQKGGEKLLNVVGAGAEKASPTLKRRVGYGAAGTAAAGTAAAGAGAHHMSKKSLDEAAYETAAEFLRENGIDPETGNKLAGDEDLTEEKIAARAVEMLREAGYEV